MNIDPKVSIIIPTYNRANLLKGAIESILNQTYQDFEIIVVDDGSTDNTEEIVRDFHNEKIAYIRHKVNKAAAAARNTGIKSAKSEYIAFHDDDGRWFPEKLRMQMDVFKSAPSNMGVVYSGFWIIKKNKREYIPSKEMKPRSGKIYKYLLRNNFVGTPSALVKRDCFRNAGLFDERLPRLQDWELWIRISKFYQFHYIPQPLLEVCVPPNSIFFNVNAYVEAMELIIDKHIKNSRKRKKLMTTQFYHIGTYLYANKDYKQASEYIKKALKIHPFHLISLIINSIKTIYAKRT